MQQPNVLATETGAVRELAQLLGDPIYLGAGVPRGDGLPVVVLPGLFANDLYLQPIRLWLRRIGYRPVRSTLALNVGCPQRLCLQVEDVLQREMARRAGPVALIGHSRGGILARAVAARLHDNASHLIVLGSPVGAILRMPEWSAARSASEHIAPRVLTEASTRIRRLIDPDCDVPDCGCPFPDDLARPLSARTAVVSIYSRDDPIVPARACLIDGARNVEVGGTHSGLAHNRDVYRVVGELLAEHG